MDVLSCRLIYAGWICLAILGSTSAAHAYTSPVSALTEIEPTRARAFSGAGVSVGNDASLVWLNPAAMALVTKPSITLAGNRGFFGETSGQGLVALPLPRGVMAGGIYYSSAGTATFNTPDGSTRTISLQRDTLAAISYAAVFSPGTTAGGTLKILHSELFEEYTTSVLAGDVGVQIQVARGIKAGAALRNVGSEAAYFEDPVEAPTTLQAGLAAGSRLKHGDAILAVADIVHTVVDDTTTWKAGIEYELRDTVALRAGIRRSTATELSMFALGLGFRTGACRFDYSIRIGGEFDMPQSFSITTGVR